MRTTRWSQVLRTARYMLPWVGLVVLGIVEGARWAPFAVAALAVVAWIVSAPMRSSVSVTGGTVIVRNGLLRRSFPIEAVQRIELRDDRLAGRYGHLHLGGRRRQRVLALGAGHLMAGFVPAGVLDLADDLGVDVTDAHGERPIALGDDGLPSHG